MHTTQDHFHKVDIRGNDVLTVCTLWNSSEVEGEQLTCDPAVSLSDLSGWGQWVELKLSTQECTMKQNLDFRLSILIKTHSQAHNNVTWEWGYTVISSLHWEKSSWEWTGLRKEGEEWQK